MQKRQKSERELASKRNKSGARRSRQTLVSPHHVIRILYITHGMERTNTDRDKEEEEKEKEVMKVFMSFLKEPVGRGDCYVI